MKNLLLIPVLFFIHHLSAQNTGTERVLDFRAEIQGNGSYVFKPIMPSLIQKPGAPKAYWTFYWEFGDGDFSLEQEPTHFYSKQGDFIASLDATAHYDDGEKAKRKKKTITKNSSSRLSGTMPVIQDVFDPKARQMLAMSSYSKPKAEEEITLVISYRNMGAVATDGRLHLFFNEKKFPAKHFAFVEARVHYGELVDMSTSQVLPMDHSSMEGWTALPIRSTGGVSTSLSGDFTAFTIIQEMLNDARGTYREENAWRFAEMQSREKRNLFVTLACTPNMLRDTNAIIHLQAVFAPFDPAVAPEKFVYEIEIVGSHDPNAIAVSDNRVNYRTLGSKKLDYKIQFQNNGEGPASKVEVKVELPKGLNAGAMRPVEWYPKCPICPKPPTNKGCLDTASVKDGLVFTFRNIYLPGTRQKDVEHRDSTKGFVKYRMLGDRNMPKLPFRSRAKIVFDKNTPIYTNYTKTGFKIGLSPGLKVGYGFDPDSIGKGYIFLGASLSPYKSWRIYPQVELLTGLKGHSDVSETNVKTFTGTGENANIVQLDSFFTDTLKSFRLGFVSFEIPFLMRKNFSRNVGVGLGASVRILLENGTTKLTTSRTTIDYEGSPMALSRVVRGSESFVTTIPYHATHFRYSIFADLTLGSVRAGPNFGIRGGVILGNQQYVRPFVQLSAEMKL